MPFVVKTFRCLSIVSKSLLEEPVKKDPKSAGKVWSQGASKDGFRVLIRVLKDLKKKKEVCDCIDKDPTRKML